MRRCVTRRDGASGGRSAAAAGGIVSAGVYGTVSFQHFHAGQRMRERERERDRERERKGEARVWPSAGPVMCGS